MNTYYFKINAVDAHVSQDGLDNVSLQRTLFLLW